MAITINETSVAAETTDPGIKRRRLLTNERVKGTRLLLDRVQIAAGATMQFELPAKSFAWLQLLDGDATFKAYYTERMSDSYSVLLPPGFPATLCWTRPRVRLSVRERRMKCDSATNSHRKSGGA